MALPLLRTPTPKAPSVPELVSHEPSLDEYAGLERLDRDELDDVPDDERSLPSLDWDEDGEQSGIKRRR